MIESFSRPSAVVKVRRLPSASASSPSLTVPIHSVPLLSSARACRMSSACPARGKGRTRSPARTKRPRSPAIHNEPSARSSRARAAPAKPSAAPKRVDPVLPDARHAGILGADPEAAGTVAQHRPDEIARQTLARGPGLDGAVLESVESAAVGPYPEAPFAVFVQGPDEIVAESVARVEGREGALAQARQATAVRADPEIAVAVEGERPDALVRQALASGVGGDGSRRKVLQAAAGGADPQPGAVGRQRQDRVARKTHCARQRARPCRRRSGRGRSRCPPRASLRCLRPGCGRCASRGLRSPARARSGRRGTGTDPRRSRPRGVRRDPRTGRRRSRRGCLPWRRSG